MRHIALVILALTVLVIACSKNAPAPVPPPSGSDTTHKHDTIPTPPGGPHDTTTKPPTETPGKSVVVGMYRMDIFLDNSKEIDGYGIGTYVRVVDRDTSHYSAEIINAYKGTSTIDFVNNGDSDVIYSFSNFYHSKTGEEVGLADTAGNIQFHVFRKDGKNIKTGVKDVYMVLETYPANVVGQGTIRIGAYPGNRRKLNVDSLVQIVGRRATLTLLNSDGF